MENNTVYYAIVSDSNIVKKCLPFFDDTEFEKFRRTIPVEIFDGKWIRVTNYSRVPDKNWIYLEEKNLFFPPQPYPSWILDENYNWNPPISVPQNSSSGIGWTWDEENLSWTTFNQ